VKVTVDPALDETPIGSVVMIGGVAVAETDKVAVALGVDPWELVSTTE
jgi:hypothetical protein